MGQKKTFTVEDISHHDEELSFHDSLSDDELQEVHNDHATYTCGFASKVNIQDDHHLYDQSRSKEIYNWLYYSQVAHGLCVKSVRFSIGNQQCQQEGEEVLGVTTQ